MTDIVVVSYNTLDYLKSVVDDLRRTALNANLIVVDNNSQDGSAEWLDEQDDLTVVYNDKNRGYAPACNQGLVAGDAPYVVFLNTDLTLYTGWLEATLAAFDDPEVLIAGPKSRRKDGVMRNHDIVSGCCLMARREWLERTGGMDDTLKFGYDDLDLTARARIDGKAEVVDFTILHVGAQSGTKEERAAMMQESLEAFTTRGDQPLLRYTRTNGKYLIGVPARDLTRGEVLRAKRKQGYELEELLEFGYEMVEETALDRAQKANTPAWVHSNLARAGKTLDEAQTMTREELIALDGIGEHTADEILDK